MRLGNCMRTSRIAAVVLGAVMFMATTGEGCERTNVALNSRFQLWCAEELCDWELEQGDIERVPTWHRQDWGVELVGDDVAISQALDLRHTEAGTLDLRILAKVQRDALLTLEADFMDDGIIESRWTRSPLDWETWAVTISTPIWFQGVRLRLRKTGPGRVILADFKAFVEEGSTRDPLPITNLPDGAQCLSDADCASGLCAETSGGPLLLFSAICGQCALDTTCPAGQVCGIEQQGLISPACGAPARHLMGELCMGNAECTTGLCCGGICSSCCVDGDCETGETCADRRTIDEPGADYGWAVLPRVCSPGAGLRVDGEPCLENDDCASNTCSDQGVLQACEGTGRTCQDDADCVQNADFEGSCLRIGVAGGVCDGG